MEWTEEIAQALENCEETSRIDFKSEFDPAKLQEWLEVIKDIVAMANSGGGSLLFGVSDNGQPTGADITHILEIDPADVTNKINKYAGQQFHSFHIRAFRAADKDIAIIHVESTHIPIVFVTPGTYEQGGKQRNAFAAGAVYFRHGAKSEPCNSVDLRMFVERQVDYVRRSWLDGIAKVVAAPPGARIEVVDPATPIEQSSRGRVRLTSDPTAGPRYAASVDDTHPFRQKEVVAEVNRRLSGRYSINTRDVLCLRRVHNIEDDINFCYRQKFTSHRYSEHLVDWIIQQFDRNPNFFGECRLAYDL